MKFGRTNQPVCLSRFRKGSRATPIFRRVHLAVPLMLAAMAAGAEVNTNKIPAAAAVAVNFDRDIRPIFEQSCLRCHGPEKPKSHFRLTDRAAALKGGDDNPDDIVPGDSAHSKLIYYVSGAVEDMQMPPTGKGDPLTLAQIGLLRAWIDQGAVWSATNQNQYPQSSFSMTPDLRWIGLSGSRSKFQEIEGTKPGFGGGLQDIFMEQQDAPDKKLTIQGHFLAPDANLGLKIDYTKADAGFVRSGFDYWRKYYDDRGGFFPPTNSESLNRNLYLNNGRAWIDFGLTLPDRPQAVLGYEYQFKQGDESTLQWGAVQAGANTPHISPASKHIDENTQIIKLKVNYEPNGWQFEDNARAEFYTLQTSRTNGWPLSPVWPYPPTTVATVAEGDRHVEGMNTLSLNKQFTDWLSVYSGYYYSQLDGDASVHQNTLDSTGGFVQGNQWTANDISLKRQSQVVSLGSLIGPWSGLTCSVGVQGEWTHQEASGLETLLAGVPPPGPSDPLGLSSTNNESGKVDLASVRESLVLRYTTVPHTVFFAEARLLQENLQRDSTGFVQSFSVGPGLFTNNSSGDIMSQEYRAGFNTSPWQRLSFGADYKYQTEHADYSGRNSILGAYPGFIEWRDTEENQVNARLVYRATAWLRTSFNFQWRNTDFNSAPFPIPGFTVGSIEGGQQEAHIYSLNALITPARRVYLSGTLSYSDSRIDTPFDGATSGNVLVPWQGQIYSALANATWLLSTNTNLHLTGSFSQSDFAQNNQATGLPAGINYQHYGLQFGITRRFAKNLITHLAYNFYQYREPTSGNFNNYTAQGVLGSITIPWP